MIHLLKWLYHINILLCAIPVLLYASLTLLTIDDLIAGAQVKFKNYRFDIITYIWVLLHLIYLFIIIT